MDEPLDEPPAAPLGGLQTDFAELRQAWINEKAAPEILQCVPFPELAASMLFGADNSSPGLQGSSLTW
jgi:hypothetical protein